MRPGATMPLMVYGLGAYILWGFFPAFFPLLEPASPLEILAHRIIWTMVVMGVIIAFTGHWRDIIKANAKTWVWMTGAAILIAINWGTYVLAVNSGHVAEAALGYFINPLMSVALGVLVLRERLRQVQAIAIGIATAAVTYLTIAQGTPPLIGLTLAISFALYGLMKKQVRLSPLASLTMETIILFPVALGYWVFLARTHTSTFSGHGTWHLALLVSAGLVTAVPLLLFNKAAQVLPLATLGIIQFITPNLQAAWAFFVKHEPSTTADTITFAAIWFAVVLYLADIVRTDARRRNAHSDKRRCQ